MCGGRLYVLFVFRNLVICLVVVACILFFFSIYFLSMRFPARKASRSLDLDFGRKHRS